MPRPTKKRTVSPNLVSKAVLANEIARIINDRELTQTEVGYETGEAPSQISLIVNGKLGGFSSERLIRLLTALGRDVEIRIARAKGATGRVRLNVK